MVTIKIKENSKQAKMFVEYAKTLSYVEFLETPIQQNKKTLSLKEKKFLNKLKKTAIEMKQLSSGKTQGQTLQSFLDEI
ncbi:hypothetical protein [Flavobacterium sp.]|jgi:hypothetical protein|uniref:hypothetical protein n=1 Tax=Flavobacterium sp. TaxID=239 RepID=UPI0037BEDBC3